MGLVVQQIIEVRGPLLPRSLCAASILVLACGRGRPPPDAYGADQISQLDVELTSDLVVPKDADSIRVDVVGLDVVGLFPKLFELGPAGVQLPRTITGEGIIFAASEIGKPPDRTLDVTVTAWKGASPLTVARATASIPYQPGYRVLRISLSWLCAGMASEVAPGRVASTCPAGQSCRAGVCQSDDRRTEPLPEWDPLHRPACFDVATCSASGSTVNVDLATCTAAASDATNFAVVKPAGSEGVCTATSCIAPLRMDPIEGWSVTGGTVSFPPAVCSALAAGRASGVIASNACPTWSPEQRFCATP
jgi:hypothetical protein